MSQILEKEIKVPDYDPSQRQVKFHTSKAFETLYGGAAGGGKTAALCAQAVTYALRYPGITIYVFRNTIPELKKTILPETRRQCAAYMATGKMSWHGTDREFRFENGSVIVLAYMEHPGDEYNYQGAEIQILMFDELTHFYQEQYDYLKTRVRHNKDTLAAGYPLKVMAATNPGNIGHGWVQNRFVDAGAPEQPITDPITGLTRVFIPAKVSDHPNKEFRDQYTLTLLGIEDDALRRALLEGDWSAFEGQVFKEWRRDKHVVDPFSIPDYWPKWMGYDYGYNTRAAALWFAKDPQSNRIYIYREMYVTEMPISQQAQMMLSLDGSENIPIRLADPAMWKGNANAETGETAAKMFQDQGVFFTPSNNDRLQGKRAWHEALAIKADGLPGLQVFSSCMNLIRTLPTLPYDKHKVEDVDTTTEDHLYDAGRYGLVNQRPKTPPSPFKPMTMVAAKRRYA